MKKATLILIIVFALTTIVNGQSKIDSMQIYNESYQRLFKEFFSNSDSEKLNVEYVNSILWTNVSDVKFNGNYAYCLFTNGLVILDFSDRTEPIFISKLYLHGVGHSIFLKDSYAFVADGSSGLQIINISDSVSPSLAGSYDTPGLAYGVAVSGNYAYVADHSSGLQIIDISDPESPSFAGSYNTSGWANGVAISGNYAYVADDLPGIKIIDISDPTSPSLAGSYDTPGSARSVVINENYAYVEDLPSGLQIIDITDPTHPSLTGSYDTPGWASGVAISGDFAYVADYYSGLQIINIGDPTSPSLAGSYNTPGIALNVVINGDYAYVSDFHSGLQVIDISDPASPTFAGSYEVPDIALDVVIGGNSAYVANGSSGLQIIDTSDPILPSLAGSYDTPDIAHGVAFSGNYAYVADGLSGLLIIDIGNPASPFLAGSYDTPDIAFGVAISGDYAYVADGSSGLQIINISDPASPSLVGSYDTPGSAYDVAIREFNAYVADGSSGLQIINISDPTSPSLAGSHDTPGSSHGVALSEFYAYVADGSSGLLIINISNPSMTALAGSYDTPDIAQSVTLSGNNVYVADGLSGLQIIDISDPASPFLTGSYDTFGLAHSVAISENYTYVADDISLMILRTPFYSAIVQDNNTDVLINFPNDLSLSFNFTGGNIANEELTVTLYTDISRAFPDVSQFNNKLYYFDVIFNVDTFEVEMTLEYTDSLLTSNGIDEDSLAISYYGSIDSRGNMWHSVPIEIDNTNNTITYTTNHLSLWAITNSNENLLSPFNPNSVIIPDTNAVVSMILTNDFSIAFNFTSGNVANEKLIFTLYDDISSAFPDVFQFDNELYYFNVIFDVDTFEVEMTLEYADSLLINNGLDEDSLAISYYDSVDSRGYIWHSVPIEIDNTNNTITYTTNHLSLWAIWGRNDSLISDVREPIITSPISYKLYQNYPNPFNPATTIQYSLPKTEYVTISVYNSLGQLIKTLVSEQKSAGEYNVIWDGKNLSRMKVSSGLYLYSIKAGEFRSVKRMLLIK